MNTIPVEPAARIHPVTRRDRTHSPVDERDRRRHPGEERRPSSPRRGPERGRNDEQDDLAPSATVGHIVDTFALPPDCFGDSRAAGGMRGARRDL